MIPIPLRGEEIVRVDLQAILNTVYDRHGFDYKIYDESISPPLPAEDAAWVARILKTAGISTTA